MPTLPPARLDRVLETALYVADMPASRYFYVEVLGGEVMLDTHRLVAVAIGGTSVLLLFQRGSTEAPLPTPGGVVPGHGGYGMLHIAFAIAAGEVAAWEARLGAAGVAIESVVEWPAGGRSIYLRDPDGHSLELATPGLWPSYQPAPHVNG